MIYSSRGNYIPPFSVICPLICVQLLEVHAHAFRSKRVVLDLTCSARRCLVCPFCFLPLHYSFCNTQRRAIYIDSKLPDPCIAQGSHRLTTMARRCCGKSQWCCYTTNFDQELPTWFCIMLSNTFLCCLTCWQVSAAFFKAVLHFTWLSLGNSCSHSYAGVQSWLS